MRYQAAPLPDMELYNSFVHQGQDPSKHMQQKTCWLASRSWEYQNQSTFAKASADSLHPNVTYGWLASRSPVGAKAGGPGGTRTPDLAVMSGQL